MTFNDNQKLYLSRGIVNRETIRAFRHDNFHKIPRRKNIYVLKDLKVTLQRVVEQKLPVGYMWISEDELFNGNKEVIYCKNGLASTGDVINRVSDYDRGNIYILQIIPNECFSNPDDKFDQLLNNEMEQEWYGKYKIEVATDRGTKEDVIVPKQNLVKFLELKVKTLKRLLNTDITMKKFLPSQRHIDCLDKYGDVIQKNTRYFLLDCVMRFGKSFIFLEMIKQNYHNLDEYKVHAIFCHDTKTYGGWKSKVKNYYSDCIDIVELKEQKDFDFTTTLTKNVVILVSPQLISSDEKLDELRKLHIEVENTFVDEAHDYFTEKWRNYYESITRNNITLASGTAAGIKITYRDFFDEYNTHTFSLFDLIRVLEEEDEIKVRPVIKRINISDMGSGKYNLGNLQGVDELNELVEPLEVDKFLEAIHDTDLRTSPISVGKSKHNVVLVDRVQFAEYWRDWIEARPELNIVPILVAGTEGKRDAKTENQVKKLIEKAKSDGKNTLTITCGSMIQGVSIRDWKEVMNLSSVSTYTMYFQFFGRTWEFDKELDSGKTFILYCWDYNPDRVLKVIAQGVESLVMTDSSMNNSSVAGIDYFFKTISIMDYYSESNGWIKVPLDNLINQIREKVDTTLLGTGFKTRKIADTRSETIFGELSQEFIEHLLSRKEKPTQKQIIKIKDLKSEIEKQKSNYTKGQSSNSNEKTLVDMKSILDKIIEGLNTYTDKIDIVMEVLLKKGLINYKNINELFPLYDNEMVMSGFEFPNVETSKYFMDYIEKCGDKIKINKKLENNHNRIPNITDDLDLSKEDFFEKCDLYDDIYTYGKDKSQLRVKDAYNILEAELKKNKPTTDSRFLIKYPKSGSLQIALTYLLYNGSKKYFGKELTKQEVINMIEFQEDNDKFVESLNTTIGFTKLRGMGLSKKDFIIINPPYKRGKHLEILLEAFNQLSDGGTLICLHPSAQFLNGKPADSEYSEKVRDIVSRYKTTIKLINGNKIFNAGFFTPLSITRIEKTLDSEINVIYSHIDESNKKVNTYKNINDIYIHSNDIVLSIIDKINKKNHKSISEFLFRKGHINNHYLKFNILAGNKPKDGKLNPDFYCLIYKKDENDFDKLFTNSPKGKRKSGGSINELGVDSRMHGKNAHSYLMTKFTRFCLSLRKTGGDLNYIDLEMIPYMDFSQEWTDEKLFDYFELNQEEIDFINTYIQNWYERDN